MLCIEEVQGLIFLNAWSSSLLRSARFTSKTRPFSCSLAILVPCVLVQRVLPQLRTENMLGALMSYHSFLRNGSPAFFLPPFFPPFVSRLFLPTAIATRVSETRDPQP